MRSRVGIQVFEPAEDRLLDRPGDRHRGQDAVHSADPTRDGDEFLDEERISVGPITQFGRDGRGRPDTQHRLHHVRDAIDRQGIQWDFEVERAGAP